MGRYWTEEDIEFLSDNVGLLDYPELSKKLGRSVSSIKLYRCRHNLPTFYGNFYTQTLLAKELGRSRRSIRKYHLRGWLVGNVATWKSAYGKRPMIFLERDIVAFLRSGKVLFDWEKVPNVYFRNVLRGLG